MNMIQNMEESFLIHCLHGASDVLVALRQWFFAVSRGPEQVDEGHRVKGPDLRGSVLPLIFDLLAVMPEVGEIQFEAAAVLQANNAAHVLHVARLAIRCQAHHLVFVSVMREPEVLGQRFIEDAQGMGEVDFVVNPDLTSGTATPCRARKVAKAIDRNDRRLGERGSQKCRTEMSQVMFDEMNRPIERLPE